MRFTSLSDSPISAGPPRLRSIAAAGTLLYSSHIILTILMTIATQTCRLDAASIASKDTSHRTRHKLSRITRESSNQPLTETQIGERNCTYSEQQEQGCLAGSCAAIVASQRHTFVICRCPPDRQGPRCEEVAINTDDIAEILKQQTNEELCKKEQYDLLAKQIRFNEEFLQCVLINGYNVPSSDPDSMEEMDLSEKQRIRAEKRELKRIERAKKRERKLRRRERKRAKKLKRIAEKEKSSKSRDNRSDHREIRQRDTSKIPNNNLNVYIAEKDFEAAKDHSGHKHKIRHEGEKSLSRRRRKLSSESRSKSRSSSDESSSNQQVFIADKPDKSSRRRKSHTKTFLVGTQAPLEAQPQS